ncbi:hypothetical protein QPM05_12600 [Caldibacillus thermoamylovorans]|nr:hypothetical protein [Caldibacillus thermoamylovorans]
MSYDLLKRKWDLVIKFAIQYGIQNIRVIDVAKIQVEATSDLDLLVDVKKERSLLF